MTGKARQGTGSGLPTTSEHQPRRRNAAHTRQRLLDAARRRFAAAGYEATTVRDIADDAGVNVALVNRYFTSKVGLFEALLTVAVDELNRATDRVRLDQVPQVMARQIIGQSGEGTTGQLLPLLLRSSGDERADRIRLEVLNSFAERLARAAGWRPGTADDAQLMLRAQVTLSAAIGIALLRCSAGLQPLTAAGEQDLAAVLGDLVGAVLSPG